jgi:hypothetical protein
MNEAIELYNNIMGLEIDMILNPDIYDESRKKKCRDVINKTGKQLHDLGFIINEEGNLVEIK